MNNHLDFFVWTYKDLKGIPLHIPQQHIKLDTMIPNAHYTKYHTNPHCVIVIKHDFNELFVARFIKLVDQTTWLYRIVVVPKKNGKLHICIDFHKLNTTTQNSWLIFTYNISSMRWPSSWLGPFYMGGHALQTQECTTYLSMCDSS